MNTEFASAQVYTNLQGLAELKLAAQQDDPASLREVAKQFESMFIQMMLKTMREATLESELLGSDQMQFHQEMFDQQLAIKISEKRSLGIADMLVRQLGDKKDMPVEQKPFNEMIPAHPAMASSIAKPATHETVVSEHGISTGTPEFESPEEFIEYMRPLAEQAAEKLGVNADVLVAQSALETGWGRKIIRTESGENSHNLFGIKAHGGWDGPTTRVNTLEFMDGTMQQSRATFRMYDSFAESFEDYAEFLQSNPRYHNAINKSRDSGEFITALQTAGYATDPDYAGKVISIMDRYSI